MKHEVAPAYRADGDPTVDDESTALFVALYPRLRRFAAVVAPAEDDPDDLVQEAIARTLRVGPLRRLDAPEQYLRTAMVRIAKNRRRSLARGRKAVDRMARSFDEGALDAALPLAILDDLTPRDRAIVYLAVIENVPIREIARVVGQRESAVRMRKHRALLRLREALEREEDLSNE